MAARYRTMLVAHAPSYRALFERIAAGRLPILFHCTAGKDRTGIAAALILLALNVPRAMILADYRKTSAAIAHGAWRQGDYLRGLVDADPSGILYQPMFAADDRYLEAMFDELDNRYGSIDAYLDRELALDASHLRRMREQLIASA